MVFIRLPSLHISENCRYSDGFFPIPICSVVLVVVGFFVPVCMNHCEMIQPILRLFCGTKGGRLEP